MKRIFIVLIIVLLAQYTNAQTQNLKIANRYFDRTYYSEAIPLYEDIIVENRSFEVVKNLADSYYYTNDLKSAKKWYHYLIRTFGQNLDEEYYFRYIQTLKAAAEYEEANKVKRQFLTKKNDTQALETLEKDIHELENVSAIGNRFDIKNLPLNTKFSEFGAVKYAGDIIYSGVNTNLDKKYKWNNENYLDLIKVADNSKDSIGASFSDEINTKMHEGNAVFTKDGNTVYFTRNNSKNGKKLKNKQKISNLQIYKAEFVEGRWTNIISLPFNNEDYSTEHPALSNDEKTLYFASDMPGSLGSFDIFSVKINDGAFETPKNLGPKINTAKKEQFPFVSKDEKFYFSSNGHFGYGSIDVFVSKIDNETFSKPENVGLPVNSGYDDFAFNIDSDTKQGYFSSNRLEGQGGDDIYSLLETKPLIIEDCKQYIAGIITDADTKLPLENAIVVLQDANKQLLETITTTADGTFRFTVGCETNYTVLSSKEKYTKDSRLIKINKERLKTNDASMALKSEELLKKEEQIAATLQAETKKKEKIATLLATEKDVVRDKDRLLIKTEPIYFDYDLWYIRKESKPILNRVIEIMKKYPEMVIEIGSHTDARGNNKYNLDLSSKRAASTRTYFIQQGIPAKRIFSKGYGETVQIVKCIPEDSCSEEQHELNRRSEFVIKNL
ncbi:MAG: flagellar motor protein MotB [Flavobacterium sp.]|nr:MAG: flagellar motor protein MotB [Flavobacterium sp.]